MVLDINTHTQSRCLVGYVPLLIPLRCDSLILPLFCVADMRNVLDKCNMYIQSWRAIVAIRAAAICARKKNQCNIWGNLQFSSTQLDSLFFCHVCGFIMAYLQQCRLVYRIAFFSLPQKQKNKNTALGIRVEMTISICSKLSRFSCTRMYSLCRQTSI